MRGAQFDPEVVDAFDTLTFHRLARILENEQSARAANEESHAPAGGGDDDELTIVCECGDEDCAGPLVVRRSEYRAVRGHERRFLVDDGHVFPEGESVVARNARFLVVEKRV